jgi:outer membrane lipoprotein-sorting protein
MKSIKLGIIVILAGIFILTGCRLSPEDVVAKGMGKMAALKTVQSTLDFSLQSEGMSGELSGTIQNQFPSQTHMVLESNGQTAEILSPDGSSFYLLDTSNQTWQETPEETIRQLGVSLSTNEQIEKLQPAMINLDGTGQDTVNGTNCARVTYDLDPEKSIAGFLDTQLVQVIDPGSLSGKGSLCVAEKTFYILENNIEITFKVKGMDITESTKMTNSNFDEPVTIPSLMAQPTPTP